MAEELRRVRIGFVDNSTRAILSQLIDDLHQDSVLNSGEKEAIEEGCSLSRDRARLIIDSVVKKGDAASWKMIAHLEKRDRHLFDLLGLNSRPCSSAAVSLNHNIDKKTGQEEDSRDTSSTYPVTEASMKNRVALLITNIEFSDPGTRNRKGAEKDQENMQRVFKSLGYNVVSLTNLTGLEMERAVIEFSKHPKLKATDSVVVIIGSHGKPGKVLGVGPQPDEFVLSKIYEHLNTESCPALLDKPKIVIIQACRGGHSGTVYVEDGPQEYVEDALQAAHKEKDFISIYACTPDTKSYRHPVNGSVLLQRITEVFEKHAHKDHIEELFRKVMQRSEEPLEGGLHQMPTKERCTLPRNFYFMPL